MLRKCSLIVGFCRIKQLRHEFLREPDGFVLVTYFNAILAGLISEDEKLRSAVTDGQAFGGLVAHAFTFFYPQMTQMGADSILIFYTPVLWYRN